MILNFYVYFPVMSSAYFIGGSLMQAVQSGDGLVERCPDDVQRDLAALHASLAELLRHFWACFPPTTPQLQEKAAKMHETLKKFQQVRVCRTTYVQVHKIKILFFPSFIINYI
jgi:hypothetical protein